MTATPKLKISRTTPEMPIAISPGVSFFRSTLALQGEVSCRIGHIAAIGILLHGVYLGGCYLAIYGGMPAGMAALIVGFQPILTAAMAGPVLGERTRPLQWIGIAIGFVGLMMVLWERQRMRDRAKKGSWTPPSCCGRGTTGTRRR